jgi:5-methylcytosine-specific restriction endonuclease McrA
VARGVRRKTRVRVFERDNYRCRYCGFDMTLHFPYPHLMVMTVDHVIPRHRGGTNAIENLVTCCYRCNFEKGHLSADRFFEIIARRAYDLSIQSSLPPPPSSSSPQSGGL